MAYGSTIRQKKGNCSHPGCVYFGPLIGGKCNSHYWSAVKMKSVAKLEEKEEAKYERLADVMEDLDAVFSQFIRLRDSDENGYIACYCCGSVVYWVEADCMHYVPRIHKNTRYSEDNCKGGCSSCNRAKGGNLKAYGDHLERDRPGSVDALEEQARAPYNYDIPELKSLISYYAKEVRAMRAKKPLKS
jgi:hypothetical protein